MRFLLTGSRTCRKMGAAFPKRICAAAQMPAISVFHGQVRPKPRKNLAARSGVMAANGKAWSRTWTFLDGDWHEGNVPIMGPRTHAAWLASCVFDGARAFEGVTPDLDLHCARIND